MGVKPLTVAAAAAVLLVVVLGADASMNRTIYVDVWDGTGWQTILEEPFSYERYARPYPTAGAIEANASDDVRFRLRIDNGYPWSSSEEFVVFSGSSEVARGTLDLAPRAEAWKEFTVRASTLMGRGFEGGYPAKDPAGFVSGGIEVRVDGKSLFAGVTIKEVAK